jgi:murein DD-endopeptidase MepM/ murein hydrolase activator NlpD
MIRKTFVCSPVPCGHLFSGERRRFLNYRATAGFCFALLCLGLSISSVAAQTRPFRANVKQNEDSRRVEDKEKTGEAGKSGGEKQTPQPTPSLIRKTALTYPPRTGNQGTAAAAAEQRPALTNEIVIISRAEEIPTTSRLGSLRTTSASIPSIWPVIGNLRSGVGIRSNPFGGSSLEYHKGQDISAPSGTPVVATADGSVVIAGWLRGYGQVVYIDHGNGITTRYGHLSRIDVSVGQMIRQGERLGLVGSTGRSTGPHLHYEVRINGQPTSPIRYLPAVAPLR